MAGRPKRRARLQETARRIDPAPSPASIPDAKTESAARAHNAQARAPARARDIPRPPSPLRPVPLGPQTRGFSDSAQSASAQLLSAYIRPGVTVRIERTRPSWAAGFIEDYPVDTEDGSTGLAQLYEHLRDEHGGSLYRVTVLAAGEEPLYAGAIPVAGPVRERGRKITRDDWDPPADRGGRAAVAAQAPSSGAQSDLMPGLLASVGTFLQLFMTQQAEAAKSAQNSVKEMINASQKQTSDLVSAVLQVRSDEQQRGGVSGQVGELVRSLGALERARKAFGAAAPAATDRPDESLLDSTMREALKGFVGAAMPTIAAKMAGSGGAAAPNGATPVGSRQATVAPSSTGSTHAQPIRQSIPDAIASQPARKN